MAVKPRDGWQDKHQKAAEEAGHESWEAWIAAREDELGYVICGGMADALGKRDGPKPCGHAPEENGRCRFHGAHARWGPAHWNWQGGKTSRYLPEDIARIYEDLSREDLLSMLDVIRSAQATRLALWEKIRDGESSRRWEDARAKAKRLEAAMKADGLDALPDGTREAATALLDALRDVSSLAEGLEEIQRQEDHLRKLFKAQTERDRVEQEYMHKREVITLFRSLAEDMADLIQSQEGRQQLSRRLRTYLGPLGGGDSEPIEA